MNVLHQATDSVTGAKYQWTASAYDNGAGYPGPNSPANLLVLAGIQGGSGLVLHQAIDSVTGAKYQWTASAYDNGAGYPGPNSPANLLVLAGLRRPSQAPARFVAIVAGVNGHVQPTVFSSGAWTAGTAVTAGDAQAYDVDVTADLSKGLVTFFATGSGVRPLAVAASTGALALGSMIVTGNGPTRVKITSDGLRALVCHWDEATVADMRFASGAWIKHASLATSAMQFGLSIAPNGLSALVASYGSGSVTPLYWSGTDWSVGTAISIPGNPRQVTIAPDGLTALVATNAAGGSVRVLHCTLGVWSDSGLSITTGTNTYHAAITPDGLTALVVAPNTSTTAVLSKTSGTWAFDYNVATEVNNYSVAISPDGSRAFLGSGEFSTQKTLVFSAGTWTSGPDATGLSVNNGTCVAGLLN